MKKQISLIFGAALILMSSCASVTAVTADKEVPHNYRVQLKNSMDLKLTTIEVDGCEYLMGWFGVGPGGRNALAFTHKGNCKYCSALQKK